MSSFINFYTYQNLSHNSFLKYFLFYLNNYFQLTNLNVIELIFMFLYLFKVFFKLFMFVL